MNIVLLLFQIDSTILNFIHKEKIIFNLINSKQYNIYSIVKVFTLIKVPNRKWDYLFEISQKEKLNYKFKMDDV